MNKIIENNYRIKHLLFTKYYYLFFLIVLFSGCDKDATIQQKKPNILFVLVDDLGWSDLGYSGSTFYETPNIDLLSEQSIQFTNAYASGSVCSPSRASIMTGKHPARINITDWIPGDNPKNNKLLGPNDLNELPLSEVTIAEMLKNNGYSTFFAGKWHLGSENFSPEHQGFDINKGGTHMGQPPGGYYSPYKNPKLSDGPEGEYLTDRLTQESINFISSTEKQKPFFLFLPYYTVHTPIQPNKKHIEKFKAKLLNSNNSDAIQRTEQKGVTRIKQGNPAYASMLYSMDENMGKLISILKEKGLYDNTLIIFTSDNGGHSTLMEKYNAVAPTSNEPLRAGKGWLYEGGIRVPLLIKPVNYDGTKIVKDVPVIGHDFFPTILSIANIKSENSAVDGVDLSPILNKDNNLLRDELYWHYPHYHGSAWTPGVAIRKGDWKLIQFYETKTVELYNLKNDISEKNNLASKHPEKVRELENRILKIQESINANTATLNPKVK